MLTSVRDWWTRWRTEGYRALWSRVYSKGGLLEQHNKLVASQPRVVARARLKEREYLLDRLTSFTRDPSAPGLWTHDALIEYLSKDD